MEILNIRLKVPTIADRIHNIIRLHSWKYWVSGWKIRSTSRTKRCSSVVILTEILNIRLKDFRFGSWPVARQATLIKILNNRLKVESVWPRESCRSMLHSWKYWISGWKMILASLRARGSYSVPTERILNTRLKGNRLCRVNDCLPEYQPKNTE